MTTLTQLQEALEARSFEVVNANEQTRQLRIMGRVPGDVTSQRNWLLVVDRLLLRAESAGWSVDASKQYLRHANGLRFAWRLIFQGENLPTHYADIATTIKAAPQSSRVELTEFPLTGSRQGRGSAGPVGKVPVGPAAKRG